MVPRITALIAAVLAWTVMLPGFVAYVDGVYTPGDVREKLARGTKADVIERYEAFQRREAALDTAWKLLQSNLENKISEGLPTSVESISIARDELRRLAEITRPRLRISGFADNETTLYWVVLYLALGALVFLNGSPVQSVFARRRAWLYGFTGYLVVNWVNWYRNTPLGNVGRTVYAYVHLDVSLISFVLQELRALGMFVLLRALWYQHEQRTERARAYFVGESLPSTSVSRLADAAAFIRGLFSRWQWESLLLAAAFIPWTWFYWRSTLALGDPRYLLSALLWHVAWLLTWVSISIPLISANHQWVTLRHRALAVWASGTGAADERLVLYLQQLDPLPHRQVLAAAVTAAISFLLPFLDILQAFLR